MNRDIFEKEFSDNNFLQDVLKSTQHEIYIAKYKSENLLAKKNLLKLLLINIAMENSVFYLLLTIFNALYAKKIASN